MSRDPLPDRVERISCAIDEMKQNLNRPIVLADLARTAPFSRFYFHRIFQEITTLTPARFLAALRMAEARRLLLHSGLAVGVISSRVGYTSVGTFTTQFSRLVGLSPEQFRKLSRQVSGHRIGEVPTERWPHPRGYESDPLPVQVDPAGGNGVPVVGWRAVQGGRARESCLVAASGPVRVPVPRDGRLHQLRVLLMRPTATITEALVDHAPQSYLVGSDTVRLSPHRPAEPLRVRVREPRATDPPLLDAAPLAWLAEAVHGPHGWSGGKLTEQTRQRLRSAS